MAYSKNARLLLFIGVVMVGLAGLGLTRGQADKCKALDLGQLISECGSYVKPSGPKLAPSKGCCMVLKEIDVPCACSHLTSGVEKFVSVEKAVYVARYCGIILEPGFKCGSYTIPPVRA